MLSESIWILPALPALGALVNGLLGARWREKGIAAVAVGSVGLALAAALALLAQMLSLPAGDRSFSVTLWRWLSDGALHIHVGFLLDSLAMVMVMVILFVGFLIHLYSAGYMKGEPGYRRYFVCLNLFVFFMLVLVLADNLVSPSSAGRAWDCARTCSSASGTKRSRPVMQAARPSSSTASATSGFSWGSCWPP